MPHELARLRSKLFDTPLLVDSGTFESILAYVDKRCEGDVIIDKEASSEFSMYSTLFYKESNLGVIHIEGPLTNKSTGWEAMCGGTSYESIKEDFETLAEEGAKTVAFIVSSGGGEAFGMMSTGNYLRKLADENDIKIVSYVEGLSASAAYGLTAISDEIISAKESEVGSIGVLIRLMNDSKALEQKGFERTFISAGKSKIPFAEDGSFRKGFLEDLQYKVDKLYEDFTTYVAEHRNLSVEAVKNTEANTFLAEDAIALGLVDKIMTQEEFYSYLSSVSENNNNGANSMSSRIFKFTKNEETQDMTQLAQLQEQLEQAQLEASTSVAELNTLQEKFQELEASLTEKTTQLESVVEQLAQMETEKEESKAALRKEKLSAVMSADKVDDVAASLATLDDVAFSTVLAGFTVQKEALEASDLFNELGAEGVELDVEAKTKELSTTDKLIQEKLNRK